MRFLIAVLSSFFFVTNGVAETSAPADRPCENKISCSRNSVVSVLPLWPKGVRRSEEPEGSGVVVGDGKLIATADHVIGPAKKVLVRSIAGEVMKAEIVLRDAQTDIALLRILSTLPPINFSSHATIGERACAVGNSFGLDISVTCGIVSAIRMSGAGFNRIEDFVQTDTAVNPGMSGGALVDREGRLIGVLSAIFTKKSDSNIGVNFAVSAPLLARTIEDFLDDGILQRIAPGVLVKPSLDAGQVGTMGAKIVRVKNPSPEKEAGLLVGDIILYAGDRRIKRAGAYTAALALLKKGDSLILDIFRDGERKKIAVQFN